MTTPSEVLARLAIQLQGMGVALPELGKAADLIAGVSNEPWESLYSRISKDGINYEALAAVMTDKERACEKELKSFSIHIHRIFRYHDFCATELYEMLSEQNEGLDHLSMEFRRQEILSSAYKLLGFITDSMRPLRKSLDDIELAVEQEFEVIRTSLFILFWAFARTDERIDYLKKYGNPKWGEEDPELIDAPPREVLDVTNPLIEKLGPIAITLPYKGADLGRACFDPTLLGATEWRRMRIQKDEIK